ncbi:GNAT family N-acetyltransferase [Thermodesulfobacteriota bacterium]
MSTQVDTRYSSQYETEVILKDGSSMILRPIKRDDAGLWLDFVSGLSKRTKYLRFHSLPKHTIEDAVRFCTVDYQNSFAVVAETLKEQSSAIVGIGRYYRLPRWHAAEVAFVIADAYQGKGIGTKLVEWLANVARNNDIDLFEANVLAENREMMKVLRTYGFHITTQLKESVYHVTFSIAKTKRIEKKEDDRERIAVVNSLRHLLYPQSIAIIGASRKEGSIGQLIVKGIMENGYTGILYPVNPNAHAVLSVKAYASIHDIPGSVDLAIIAVPAQIVSKVADECGRKGVRVLVVISDGFHERGPEGAKLERDLRSIVLRHGMRLVGPNCMGVINTDSGVKLNASLSLVCPPQGNVAFLSQSGALGQAILDYATNLNIGISTFVSVGNRADISANDMLQYWEQDPFTKVILLYIESFGNPLKFARIARRIAEKKPIVVVKSGRAQVGSRAVSSCIDALVTPEIASEALFRQAGIIRVGTLEDLFDVASLLSNQPVPQGRRIAILTNGGGPSILAADACEDYGLVLTPFSDKTEKNLLSVIKVEIGINNPLDLTTGATEEEYVGVLKILAQAQDIDGVIILFTHLVTTYLDIVEDTVQRAAPLFQKNRKPLLSCIMGARGFRPRKEGRRRVVPNYPFPEDAVAAFARAAKYGEWLKKPKGSIPKIRGIKRARAEKIIQTAMTRSDQRPFWLSNEEIGELLACYGIRCSPAVMCRTAEKAAESASRIGFPVAVKLASSSIVHKTDVGGVKLDLRSEEEVERAFDDIKAFLKAKGRDGEMDGVIVQPLIEGGVEIIAGITQDPSFGPLLMFGVGGIYAALTEDMVVRLHPLTDVDARELIRSIRMVKLFEGFRGSHPADTPALENLLLRLSALAGDAPQIAEMDINPVMVMPQGEGYWVVDARIMLR